MSGGERRRYRRTVRTVVSVAMLVAAVVPAAGAVTAAPAGDAHRASAGATSTMLVQTAPENRRGFWYAIGDTPTRAEVLAAPSRYGVVVLNPWETWALDLLKATDPTVTVLVYKDLSSVRNYHRGALPPTGVGVEEAEAHPTWFALDPTGQRIEWDPYPGHWQMAVWDPAYRSAWTTHVVDEVVQGGWDGVLADNDMATLAWYEPTLLAGTSSREESDALLRAGLDALVLEAGTRLTAQGKTLVPNVSEARLHPGRWAAHSAYGGAMEENFAHWGTDPASGFLWDWGTTGWVTQTDQVARAGLSLSITRARAGDTRSLLYGYTSVLVRGGPDDLWSPSTSEAGTYTEPETLPEMRLRLGSATRPAVRTSSGLWSRTFTSGWAVVNPTQSTHRATPPRGAVDVRGRRVTSVTLPPMSGSVLGVPTTQQ